MNAPAPSSSWRAVSVCAWTLSIAACGTRPVPREATADPAAPADTGAPSFDANRPPAVSAAWVTEALTGESTAHCEAEASDPEGGAVTLWFDWRVDGELVQSSVACELDGPAHFRRGQRVSVEVVASDGLDTWSVSLDPLLVDNTAPLPPVARITPEQPVAGEAIACEWAGAPEDADGDTVSVTYTWSLDGAPWSAATRDGDRSVVDGGAIGPWQRWTCMAEASDGAATAASEEAVAWTSLATTTVHGLVEGGHLGKRVVSAGDVDGDGRDDLWLSFETHAGASGAEDPGVMLVLGADLPTSGEWLGVAPAAEVTGLPTRWFALSGGADVDGDGRADLLLGDDADATDGVASGRAWLFTADTLLRGGTLDLADADLVLRGASPGDRLGAAVALTGDLDGDGFGEVFVGAPGDDAAAEGAGAVYGWSGADVAETSAAGPADAAVVLRGGASGDEAGGVISAVGDLNGDGRPDVAMGAPKAGGDAGAVYVLFGQDLAAIGARSVTAVDVVLTGVDFPHYGEYDLRYDWRYNSRAGAGVWGAGDLDGDGLGDLVVSSPDRGAMGSGYGVLSVVSGARIATGADLDLGSADSRVSGGCSYPGGFPLDVGAGSDLDGDGLADLVVLPEWGTGVAVALSGRDLAPRLALWDVASPAARLPAQTDAFSVSTPGDLDGDGAPDVVVGAVADWSVPADAGLVVVGWGTP